MRPVRRVVKKAVREGRAGERGAGAVDYLAVLLLIAAVAGVIAASSVPDDVQSSIAAGICKVAKAGGLSADCRAAQIGRPPLTASDPDVPKSTCLTDISNEILEFDTSVKLKRLDVLADGGGQLTLRRYVQGDGKPDLWQIWDQSWSDGGASTPSENKLKSGARALVSGANTEIYNFTDEKEARDFYKRLRDYRIGNWAKLAIRTNPITGAVTWGLGRLPWIGDDIEDFMGGREPDRKPSQEIYDGGLWAGFFNDIPLGGIPLSIVGRDWANASGGVWKDYDTGDTTYYVQGTNQGMESLELDVGRMLKKLKLDKRVPANVQKALDGIQQELSSKMGTPVTLPPPLRRALATDTGLGVGLRGTVSRWYGVTYDKNGRPKTFVQTDDVQGSWHLRGDVHLGPAGAWLQDSQGGTRWRTTKTLDLTDPKERNAFDLAVRQAAQQNPIGAALALDDLFDKGLGTMAKVDYDYQVRTVSPSANVGIAGIAFESETSSSKATGAEYFKPGTGWVPWTKCALH
jgi:hypothetical protein